MLCAAYQIGSCSKGETASFVTSCAQGKHVCAVVCRTGRVCGLGHAAAHCVNRKAAGPEMAVPRPKTAAKPRIKLSKPLKADGARELRTKRTAPWNKPSGSSSDKCEPSGGRQEDLGAGATRATSSAAFEQGEHPADQPDDAGRENFWDAGRENFWAEHFDRLAIKSLRKGNKFRPEPPTLIAKVCKSGGELWLGGLPTEDYLPPAPEGGFALQICCMASAPEDRTIDDKKKGTRTRRVTMPRVIVVNLNMDNPEVAAKNWPGVSKLVVRSMRQGDNAFVHCMAGVHRAALAGCMFRALLHDETLDEAIATVKQVRRVEPEKCLINHPRCRGLIAKGTNAGWISRPYGWAASTKLFHAVIYPHAAGAKDSTRLEPHRGSESMISFPHSVKPKVT